MKRIWLTRKVIASMLLGMLIFTGCGSVQNTPDDPFYVRSDVNVDEIAEESGGKLDKVYQEAFDRLMDPENVKELEGDNFFDKMNRVILNGYYKSYRTFRSISPVIVVSSIVMGWLMMKLSKQNKKIRRTGLVVFIIGIPVAVIIAVFGIGIFNGMLLY